MKKYITPKDFEIAAKNGIKKDTVIRRVVRNNWSIDEAISTPSQRYDLPRKLLEKAEKLGLERQFVIDRMKHGWGIEKACTTPKIKTGRPKKGDNMEKKYWYITPDDFERAAKNGINKDTLRQRVRTLGWDIERAIKSPLKKVRNIPQELLEEAKRKGITRHLISGRISQGWSVEKACTTETMSVGRPRGKVEK